MYLQVFLLGFIICILGLFNEETMIAAFFKLHDDVQEPGGAASVAFGKSFVIPC